MSKTKRPQRNILGDETTSDCQEDDSSSPDENHSGNFASAEREEGATDYGLEFTNTNNGSLSINISDDQPLLLQQSQKTPVSRNNIGAVKKQSQTKLGTGTLAKNKNPPPQKQQNITVRKPRKPKNPVQLEQRFLQEVRNLQKQQKMFIPRLPFSRLVRELIMAHAVDATKIQRTALEALQEASEMYLTQQLQDAYTLTLHRGRQTLSVSDMELLRFIRGRV